MFVEALVAQSAVRGVIVLVWLPGRDRSQPHSALVASPPDDEQVERIARNAPPPTPKLAIDLGIDQKALALHAAPAGILTLGSVRGWIAPGRGRR